MPLKKSAGNMYPWVTHQHTHLGGECPHRCIYCYVDNPRFGRAPRYTGELRLIEEEFNVNYGSGKTIFIEHMNDLFAEAVPDEFIKRIMEHCCKWPENEYVFQTKNPARFFRNERYEGKPGWKFPPKFVLGTTVETNENIQGISVAPPPEARIDAMINLPKGTKTFITIEPVLDFDPYTLARWISLTKPFFVNLGADSKDRGLPEPTVEKVMALVGLLKDFGIDLKEKHNLQRLKP